MLPQNLYLFFAGLALISCLKDPGHSLSPQNLDIILSGRVITTTGEPVSGTDVFINTATEPLAISEASGEFSATLSPADLKLNLDDDVPPLQVFIRSGNGQQIAVSTTISVNWGDRHYVGDLVMRNAVEMTGNVSLFDGIELRPAEGAIVTVGPEQTTTRSDGSYELSGLASGQLSLKVTFPGYEPHESLIDTNPFTRSSSFGDVILYQNQLTGVLTQQGNRQDGLQNVLVNVGDDVAVVRVATANDLNDPQPALDGSWIEVHSSMSFQVHNAAVLYYQFGNSDRSSLSPVFSLRLIEESK